MSTMISSRLARTSHSSAFIAEGLSDLAFNLLADAEEAAAEIKALRERVRSISGESDKSASVAPQAQSAKINIKNLPLSEIKKQLEKATIVSLLSHENDIAISLDGTHVLKASVAKSDLPLSIGEKTFLITCSGKSLLRDLVISKVHFDCEIGRASCRERV